MREGNGNRKCNFGKRGQVDIDGKKEHIHRGLVRIKGHHTQRNQGGSKACGRRWMNANCNNHKRNRMKSGRRLERKGLLASHILVSYLLPPLFLSCYLSPIYPSLNLALLISCLSLPAVINVWTVSVGRLLKK